MKRRKRKRGSKAASPPTPKIPSDAEMPAEPSAALAWADRQTPPRDEFIAPVAVEKPANDPTALAGADYMIDLGDDLIAVEPAGFHETVAVERIVHIGFSRSVAPEQALADRLPGTVG